MFYIPVQPLPFFDSNQFFHHIINIDTGKFMFYINFVRNATSNYFCKFSTFFIYKGQKNNIMSQTSV
ncbi:hypothetical protein GC345_05550 [Yersinia pestis]|nr:hypothetical protein CEQ20_11470 [Yersinia pseudotuberculosis]AYW82189.1 hypothetical protein EGX42_03950 [Yersinia pestis]QFR84541.1 hypothetical protein DJY80_06285 [Yersinia pestis subsp. pestis bv. Medievalis]AYX09649.1 hypothetical protein EGX52_01590 [Yersinia pseudotuberculosis]AYX20730.1 hypothetical protein EGX46_15930 [Yersinia pestis]